MLYVFPCVILFLCFSVLLVLRLPRLGKRELILVLFVRLFGLCLFRFVGFLFLLGSGKGCGLWLWHSLDFSLTFFSYVCPICACLDLSVSSSSWSLGWAAFCDCGTPWTFLLPFFFLPMEQINKTVLNFPTTIIAPIEPLPVYLSLTEYQVLLYPEIRLMTQAHQIFMS